MLEGLVNRDPEKPDSVCVNQGLVENTVILVK